MMGAICGDYIGSTYEFNNVKMDVKKKDIILFPKGSYFTDDSFMTLAIADALMNNKPIAKNLKMFYRRYPDGAYGSRFKNWCESIGIEPYNSWGNGSAMRVSSVGWLYKNDFLETMRIAEETANVTHNHPEGIKGAVSVAVTINMLLDGHTKEDIKKYISSKYGYNLNRTVEEIRKIYQFDESCQGTVPEAIICFLESDSWVDAIKNAIVIGGDTDTLCAITGSIAEAYYKHIPDDIYEKVYNNMSDHLRDIVDQFNLLINKE